MTQMSITDDRKVLAEYYTVARISEPLLHKMQVSLRNKSQVKDGKY